MPLSHHASLQSRNAWGVCSYQDSITSLYTYLKHCKSPSSNCRPTILEPFSSLLNPRRPTSTPGSLLDMKPVQGTRCTTPYTVPFYPVDPPTRGYCTISFRLLQFTVALPRFHLLFYSAVHVSLVCVSHVAERIQGKTYTTSRNEYTYMRSALWYAIHPIQKS
jgi:hypothetical protein